LICHRSKFEVKFKTLKYRLSSKISTIHILGRFLEVPLGGTENNRLGKKFEGRNVSAAVIGSKSGADSTVNAYSNLTVGYGGKTYTAGMGELQLPYIKQIGTSVAVGSVNIPPSSLSSSNSFSGVSVSGGWWVTNSANRRTPVVYHPLTPIPQIFKHSWTFPK
jgi:hypothetical protein